MKRDLLKQMKNEWRENFWLVLELLVVLLAVWYICMTILRPAAQFCSPRGFDAENVWCMKLKTINNESPLYHDYGEETQRKFGESVVTILNNIRRNRHVEAAALSANALPYQYSYMGSSITINDNDTIPMGVNRRLASPDMVKVLHYRSLNGVSEDEMVELMKKGEYLLSSYPEFDDVRDVRAYIGKPFHLGGDSVNRYISHVLIENVVRSEFEGRWGGTLVVPIDEEEVADGTYSNIWEIAVRVRPGEETAFLNDFRRDRKMQVAGNVYLGQPQSLMKNRYMAHRSQYIELRVMTAGAVFLMAIVFLGILGTFWYRIRRREGEIALRKVNGATAGDIFRRLETEGIILLSLATLLAAGVGVWYWFDTVERYRGWEWQFFASGVAAFLLMLAVVAAGIWIPARLAMKIEPATALKEE